MPVDIFKLSGSVDVQTGKAQANLDRLSADAKRSQSELARLAGAGKRAGADMAGSFDRSIGALGRLKAAASSAAGAMGGLKGAAGSVGSAFAGLGTELLTSTLGKLTEGFTTAIKAGLDYNKMLESASIVFEKLAGSVEGGNKHLAELQNFAKTSPFDLKDLIAASARMQAYGTSTGDVVSQLKNLQNAAALAAGTSGNFTEALDGIVIALGQMRANGRVSAEEMNQLAERGIPAWDLLAKKIGLSVEETRKLSEAGKLRGKPAADALLEAFGEGQFGGLAERLGKTVMGRESNLRDVLNQQAAEAGKSTFEAYRSGLEEAIRRGGTAGTADVLKTANAPVAAGIQLGADLSSGATSMKEVGAALIPTAKDTIKTLGTTISEGLAGAWKIAGELAAGVAESAGISMGQSAITGTKGALKSQSPSKVYVQIGEDTIEGFLIGFENGKKRILTANEKLVEELKKQWERANKEFGDAFDKASKKTGLPKELLMGVASRETNMRNVIGDGGRGAGVMQVDIGTDAAFKASGAWKDATASIIRGAEILKEKFDQLVRLAGEDVTVTARSGDKFKFTVPKLEGDQLTRTGVASYNSGLFAARNVSLGRSPDASTTGRDYSADVLKRAEIFKQLAETGKVAEQTAPDIDKVTKAAPKVRETIVKLGELAAPMQALASVGKLQQGGKTIDGGTVTVDVVAPKFDPVPLATLGDEFKKLDTNTKLAKAATATLSPALAQAGTATRDWKAAIVDSTAETEKAIDHFATMKDSIARGFDDLIDEWIQGGKDWTETGKRVLADFFKSTLSSLISSASGGKASSPGQLLGNIVGGLFSRQGGGSSNGIATAISGGGTGSGGGIGNFLTGGFAGGNPAQSILTGGGQAQSGGGPLASIQQAISGKGGLGKLPGLSKIGGLFRKIPGLGGLFGKGGANPAVLQNGPLQTVTGAAAGLPTTLDPTTTLGKAAGAGALKSASAFGSLASGGLLLGGGLAGSFAGKGTIGKLMGQVGGTLLAGAAGASGIFGGAIAGALPALFSNPFTAIIGAGLIGGALLSRLFGGKDLKSLKGLIRGEYGIEVKSDKVLENVKAFGESKFGKKEFKKRQIETVRLPETKELLVEYAARTGQKGNSKLVSPAALQDEFSSANQFGVKLAGRREAGGPVAAGRAYLVGEKRPEIFVPSMAGKIVPSVAQYERQQPALAPVAAGRGIVPTPSNEMQAGAGDDRKYLMEILEELAFAVGNLKSIKKGDIVEMGLAERPGLAARDVRQAFDRRTEDSMEIRKRIDRR